mgnify:FL=1
MAKPFAERLLAWYDDHGRKDLPWQQPRTPYRVWISEIMLQQTQVATVIPYFERWMASFPDVTTLAAAPQDDILAHWSGLGYYARARNIHKAATTCVSEHGGQIPTDPQALTALPGIGPSTANAIVSQATDRPAAVLDGNVRRVLARHSAIPGWIGSSSVQKKLWKAAEERLPETRGADYTQAVMDLGALLCTRSKPVCGDCPVSSDCRALLDNSVDLFPSPKPRARVGEKSICMLILRDDRGRVLLEKRPGAGIWGGLWSLPEGEEPAAVSASIGIRIGPSVSLPPVQHRLSHLKLDIRPVLSSQGHPAQVQCSTKRAWFDREQQKSLGLPKPVSDLLDRLENGEFE